MSDAAEPQTPEYRDFYYTSREGLRLYARDYGDPLSPWCPVVCLPGLSRTNRDFHQLAMHLAHQRHRPRRVLAFDYRGRGRSAWDSDPAGYNALTELGDVYAGMAAAGIARAIIVGTSRGGVLGMMMGVDRPASVAGIVLNDIGPVLEPLGLARIRAYIGRTPIPDDWAEASQIQRRLHGGHFPEWSSAEWDEFARLTYRDDGGRPVSDYDPALASALDGIDLNRPIPTMWHQFSALRGIPILLIRGENSDLLSAATAGRMQAEHSMLSVLTVAGEGHPPVLSRPSLLTRISSFMTAAEGSSPIPEAVPPRNTATFDLDTPLD